LDYSTDKFDYKFFYVTQNTTNIGLWRNGANRKKRSQWKDRT